MKILHIPCLEDNYSYMIIDETTKEAAVIDPVEPHKIFRVAQENAADLKFVLTTHHHWDHAGGNDKIKELVPGIKVYGGSIDNVRGCTDKVENGDKISLGADINILSLHTPCHTNGHISYYATGKEGEDPAVFTGDTLFIAGCGKFFEGTAEQMYQSLCVTLGSLPKPTRVFCGHEYTVKNLQFALTVEPDNEKIRQKLSWSEQQRRGGLPTIPSTIEEELETNPFMRVDLPEVQFQMFQEGCLPRENLRAPRDTPIPSARLILFILSIKTQHKNRSWYCSNMKIVTVPCSEDTYSYLIFDDVSREGAVVDPVEPQMVLEAAEEHWVDLKLILTTHHHRF